MKRRGCIGHTFSFRLILEKTFELSDPLILRTIDYEQALDTADRKSFSDGHILVKCTS